MKGLLPGAGGGAVVVPLALYCPSTCCTTRAVFGSLRSAGDNPDISKIWLFLIREWVSSMTIKPKKKNQICFTFSQVMLVVSAKPM